MIVADSGVLAARCLTGVKTHLAEKVELIDSLWIAPRLWRYEFQNILTKGLLAGQYSFDESVHIWRGVDARMSGNEYEPSVDRILDLSARHRITAYDSNFIALAMEMGVMCVTEDGELQRKFPAIAVSMKDFVRQDTTDSGVGEKSTTCRVRRKQAKK